ncbi:phage baseplate assembly protein V [Pseudoalteromonas rubra]|uniref:phage baseplate assembly protein V n=1 Tax=Pseudoalteromonas rubra TaxID=43658 RepID=UPI000F7929B8|nr:phage baseplate assembly protein V [Pseudoalteromonas rubra]
MAEPIVIESLIEKVQQLSDEIEELRRRQQMMVRLGKVVEIHESNKLIKVSHGELTTPFIKWFAQAAGQVMHYRCPSVGELVVLLNFGGGNTGSQTIALTGLESDAYAFPADNPDQVVTQFGEQMAMRWDMSAGELVINVPNKVRFETARLEVSGNVIVEQNVEAAQGVKDSVSTMQVMRDKYNAHNHSNAVGPPSTHKME